MALTWARPRLAASWHRRYGSVRDSIICTWDRARSASLPLLPPPGISVPASTSLETTQLNKLTELERSACILTELERSSCILTELERSACILTELERSACILTELERPACVLTELERSACVLTELERSACVLTELERSACILTELERWYPGKKRSAVYLLKKKLIPGQYIYICIAHNLCSRSWESISKTKHALEQ